MKYKVTLNGKTYEVEVEKGEAIVTAEYEAMVPKAPVVSAPAVASAPVAVAVAAPAASAGANTVVAPIAGVILSIKAQVGQAVKKGDTVLIIEAMKMENEIVAPRDGKVAAIMAQKGATVNTGAPLFDII